MKVNIKQVNKYEITVNSKKYTDFEKTGEWEGLIKFSGKQGEVMVSENRDNFNDIFGNIFGSDDKEKNHEFEVIKITPDLVPIKDKESNEE